ncbi:hypothetical protein VMCG_07815 [Cytospora schulzeri]|uniref:Uncharacterized protein n=1 Tax=Cytospora schulzeri TaxID=448051 RepID=A0A423VZP2_9PEZI|nr:hypothetical protein VMCG_07815 [Valsa malicola]
MASKGASVEIGLAGDIPALATLSPGVGWQRTNGDSSTEIHESKDGIGERRQKKQKAHMLRGDQAPIPRIQQLTLPGSNGMSVEVDIEYFGTDLSDEESEHNVSDSEADSYGEQ